MKSNTHSKSRFPKGLVLVLALALIVGAAIGGTIAWLSAQTDAVVNTMAVAELFKEPESQFTLWEHKAVDDDEDGQYELSTEKVKANSYVILPGVDIPKDPTVDVVELKANAYLYIKVEDNLAAGMSYSIDSANWEPLTGYNGIWVYKGEKATNHVIQASVDNKLNFTATILTDNEIVVSRDYNATANSNITFTAYMAQATGNGTNAAQAWTNTFGTTATPIP